MIRKYLELVKFSHTVFALPFALISMLVAANGFPSLTALFWILVAMVAARTMAMTFNRIADLRFDLANPRTASRPLLTGEVTLRSAWILWLFACLLFFLAAGMLNLLCLSLSPIVWMVLNGYSFTKRFTTWTHLWLGLALGLSPLGAWIAIRGSLDLPPLVLALAVLFWVAGFDVIYSLQDAQIDSRLGLHSAVVRYGAGKALWFSRTFHFLTLSLLIVFGILSHLGWIYYLGLGGVAIAFIIEHTIVSPTDLSRLGAAFFVSNGYISISLLVVTFLDIYLK